MIEPYDGRHTMNDMIDDMIDGSTDKILPGMGIFLGIMTVVSIGLLLLTPVVTKLGPPNQGWWTQPALMPALSLFFFAGTSTYLLVQHLWAVKKSGVQHERSAISAELIQWILPLEYFVYYMIYIWLLGLVGYFLSSAIFAVGICMRVGLRSARWVYTALLFALALTALFRWGLNIWFPTADLFELFPKQPRIFLSRNF